MAETIKAALPQTWYECEVIIVDDGSIENSLEIARTYEGNEVHVTAVRSRSTRGAQSSFSGGDGVLHPAFRC